jgi:Uncharacterized protein conserved in bacteria (DUF2330)
MIRRAALGLMFLTGALGAPIAAEACGGCFNPPSAVQVVTDHRMVLSLSRDRTVLWDQFRYSGNPSDFSWILPIRSGPDVVVEEADNLFLATMDNLTAPLVTRPLAPVSFCSSGFAFGSADSTLPSVREGNNGVTVFNERVVGPYQVATLGSTDPMALRNWLTSNGYAVPPAVIPIIDHYVALSMDFVAVRLRPSAEVSQMKPLRVITPGYNPTLPLRMIAAGVADKVGLSLIVIAESRVEAMNFPNGEVREADLRYDFERPTDPARDFINAFNRINVANERRVWLTESAQAMNLTQVEQQMQTCADPATMFSQPCVRDPRVNPLDLRVAFENFGDTAYVTRLRADLSAGALDRDLVLAASDRGARSRNYTYGVVVNTPLDPCASPHSDFRGCSARGGDTTTAGAICAALGLIAARARRRRRD